MDFSYFILLLWYKSYSLPHNIHVDKKSITDRHSRDFFPVPHHDDTSLVVGQHDGDETGVGTNSGHHLLHLHTACPPRHWHKGNVCHRQREQTTKHENDDEKTTKTWIHSGQRFFLGSSGSLPPAFLSFWRCSATSLTESCSTLEVIM